MAATTTARTEDYAPVRLSHVTLVYGHDAPALDDVSLEIAPGERICVVGANGSGKSTLASIMAGLLAPDKGSVELVGEHVCNNGQVDRRAYKRAHRKLGLVFQNPADQIVTNVVEDDVAFGPKNLGLERDEIERRVQRELDRVAMTAYAKADPSRLSGGQQQRVCIASALAMEPEVLILDEPASLLDVRGREAILRVMKRLVAAGTTLVHVTHFMDEALEADRVLVLDRGHVAYLGTPDEVFCEAGPHLFELGLETPYAAQLSVALGLPWTSDEDELAAQIAAQTPATAQVAMPATTVGTPATSPVGAAATVVARADHASYNYTPKAQTLNDITLEIDAGISLAIVGQTGSGKSTLLRLLCGLNAPDSGSIQICGNDTSTRRGRRAARHAVGYVMQQPERQLFAATVEKDVSFGPSNQGLSDDEVERRVTEALELVGLADRRQDSPFELSGGQQRLCAIAGVLAMEPRLLLLDEPTAGLDPEGRKLIKQVMAELHSQGATLVQVTHSMDDAAHTDHVLMLDGGSVIAEGTPEEVFSAQNEELLAKSGLGMPHSVTFARRLQTRGVNVGRPLTTEALEAALGRQPENEAHDGL